jgi:hypothetical protein
MKRREFLTAAATAGAAVTSFSASGSLFAADETIPHAAETSVKLPFSQDGTFKIAQFTDTHYRTDLKAVAIESVRLIEEILDTEKPQLAVYTGDIVTNGGTKQGWDDILGPCVERQVPFAVVLGNHDHEHAGLNRREIIDYTAKKPHSATRLCPEEVFGASNYILEILDGERVAALLYCLDSNAYSQLEGVSGYDWFRPAQIEWYRRRSAEYTRQNGGQPLPALAFFHIPLNEYGEMIHFKDHEKRLVLGERNEMECPGALNSGMFMAMRESGDVMGVFVGHDHVNDYIGVRNGIALGYGRWSGTKTTYGNLRHGSRIIELSASGERSFKTWIRLRGGEKVTELQVPQDLTVKRTS